MICLKQPIQLVIVVFLFFLFFISPAGGQEEKRWSWIDKSGQHRTLAELNKLLQAHNDWYLSGFKTGVRADLSGAGLYGADLNGTIFQPRSYPEIGAIAAAMNLELITYLYNPVALTQLRNQFKNNGFREQERKITYALKRSDAAQFLDKCLSRGSWLSCGEYLFNRVFFDLTCQYGMKPGRPLLLLVGLWFICSLLYTFIMHRSGPSGIYIVGKRAWKGRNYTQGIRLRPKPFSSSVSAWAYPLALLLRELRTFRAAMFFSLMSAFNIGFRDINFGRWLRLLTVREYDIKAVGWPRTVSGFQSLISVYLIALWLLTYFGRPFE